MIWIGPLISLETGWKKGKLPECQFFKFLADPQPFEMDGIRDDFLVLNLEFFHHRSPFQQC
ncbi:MAG: hypothetical protein EBT88_10590 [Proteobacteria bacterium]|nr:hypothetical protein [Pseudomonadota bacterium]